MPFPLFSHAHTPVRPTLTIAALGAALLWVGVPHQKPRHPQPHSHRKQALTVHQISSPLSPPG